MVSPPFLTHHFHNKFSYLTFRLLDNNEHKTKIAAFNIIDGVDTCRVGYIFSEYLDHYESLHGRIGQITEIWKNSPTVRKQQKSSTRNGVVKISLIDSRNPKDRIIDNLLEDFDTDSSGD